MSYREHLPETDGYSRIAIAVNAVVAIGATLLVLWWASGFGPFFEKTFRIAPTPNGANAGVGADWTAGNTIPWLDFMIAFVHAVDVLAGVFILFMVFLHWGAFRRLAARMRQPGERSEDAVATDGGSDAAEEPVTDGGRDADAEESAPADVDESPAVSGGEDR